MRIEWRKTGSNHWWWVIDNIEVNDEQPATFSVQPRVAFPDPDTATVSWQAPAQKAILYYGEGKKGLLEHKEELESSDGRYEVDLAALKRATTYRYRIALLENKRRRLSDLELRKRGHLIHNVKHYRFYNGTESASSCFTLYCFFSNSFEGFIGEV